MTNPNVEKLLRELPKTSHGAALKLFLDERLAEIDSVKGVKSLDEALGRQLALKFIKDIFSFYQEGGSTGSGKPSYT